MRRRTLLAMILGLVPVLGLAIQGIPGPAEPLKPVIMEAQPGTFLAPETPQELQMAPFGTEIPLDSLRKLQGFSATPGHEDVAPPQVESAPPVIQSFNTTPYTGWIPPDPDIAVGFDDIVVVVNSTIRIYDKQGTLLYSNTLGNFFSQLNPPSLVFDPRVVFDVLDHRFIVVALAMNSSTHESYYLMAISTDSTASGTWYQWKMNASTDGNVSTNNWADFPGLGYNNNALFITSNQFDFTTGNFQYAKIRHMPKSDAYAGNGFTYYDFVNFHNSDGSPAFTVKPAQSYSASTYAYFLNTKSGGWNKVSLWRMSNTGTTSPTLTLQATVSVASYSVPPPAVQAGDTAHLNTGDCRISGPVIYQNARLYTAFTEATSFSDGTHAAVRWLKINVSTNNAEIDYSGWGASYRDYFYPAVSVDPHGNMVLVCARSGTSEYAGLRYTGWIAGQSSPEPSAWLRAGDGPYNQRDSYNRNRWGDYFDVAQDPADPYTLWIYGEYATSSNTWATRTGAVKFQPNLVAGNAYPGEDFPIVPRDTVGASWGNAHLTPTLPGDTLGTYLNFTYQNAGPGQAPGHYGRLYLDNVVLQGYSAGTMGPGSYAGGHNWGPYFVRGGRHTLGDSVDVYEDVSETDETDNYYERQFVWEPPDLQANTPWVRSAPPVKGGGALPNADGFRYVKPGYYAGVVATTPLQGDDDYDLYLYTDYVDSDSGFSVLAEYSMYGSGATDFVVASWNVAEDSLYPAAVRYSASSEDDFVVEADNSVGHIFSSSGGVLTDSLSSSEIIDLYECYLLADSTYRFSFDAFSGGTPYLYLYPSSTGFHGRGDFVKAGYGSQGFLYTPSQTGWYPLVVCKPSGSHLSEDIQYTLRVERLSPGTWLGLVSTDWHTDTNWVGNAVPTSAVDVRIPAWATRMPVVSSGTGYSRNLTIESGASLEISGGQNFRAYGDVVNEGTLTGPEDFHSISVWGDFRNHGTWNCGNNAYLSLTGGGTHELASVDSVGSMTVTSGNEVYLAEGLDLYVRGTFYLYGTLNARASNYFASIRSLVVYPGGTYRGDSMSTWVNYLRVDSGGVFTLQSNLAEAEIGVNGSNFLLNGVLMVGDTFAPSILVYGDLYVGPHGGIVPGHSTLHFVGGWNQTVTDTFHTTVISPGAYNVVVNKTAGSTVTVDNHAMIVDNDLSIYSGTLHLGTAIDTIRGNVTLYGGTLDLADDYSCQLYVGGNWDDRNGVFQETSSTAWQTPWVVFYGLQEHHVWQGASNSFSGVEFHDSTTYLESDVSAYWYFNLSYAILNTQGHDVTIQRSFQIWDPPGTLIQDAGTIVARGMDMMGGTFLLNGGSLYLTLDDPNVPNWNDSYAVFQPGPQHLTAFVDTADVTVTQASSNYFANLLLDKGASKAWDRLQPLPPEPTNSPHRTGDPTGLLPRKKPASLATSRSAAQETPLAPPRAHGVTLNSNVQVHGSLFVAEGTDLTLNGHKLTIYSNESDTALNLEGTLRLQNPADSLIVPVLGRDVVVASTGEFNMSNGYAWIDDDLILRGTFVMSDGVYQTDTLDGYGDLFFMDSSHVQISGGLIEYNSDWYADYTSTWAVTGGRVHVYGRGPGAFVNYSPTLTLNHLEIGEGTHHKRADFLLAYNTKIQVQGNFYLHPGDSAYFPDHGELVCLGDSMRVDGYLDLGTQGSVLRLGAGTQVRVRNGGMLRAVGTPSFPDTITHAGSGYYGMTFYSGTRLAAEYTVFEYMNVSGIRLLGATLDPAHPLSSCTFRNSYAGGRLLLLNVPQVVVIENATFPENTWSGYVNVAKTSAAGQVTFVDAQGTFAGEAYEYDPYNTIFWETSFLPGDANHDGVVDDQDLVYLSNYLYHGGPAPSPFNAGDNDHDCSVTPADLEYLANYLYHGGPAPSPCGTVPAVQPGSPARPVQQVKPSEVR